MRLVLPSVMTAIPSATLVVRTSAFMGSPLFINVASKRTFYTKKTTCTFSLLPPSQKAFAGPIGSQTLAGCPPAALPLPVYECSSFGKSFLLDIRESKKQGGAPTALYNPKACRQLAVILPYILADQTVLHAVAGPDTLFHSGKDFQHGAFRKLECQTPALGSGASHFRLEHFVAGNELLGIRTERIRWMPAR